MVSVTPTLDVFRVIPPSSIPGRANSTRYAASVRVSDGQTGEGGDWKEAFVLQTTAKNASRLGGCGYFDHLNGWTASWLSLEISASVQVRISRLLQGPITYAAVHPASSGATVEINDAGDAVVTIPSAARFTVDFDGGLDQVDTGPQYRGDPLHTLSVFANQLDPSPPSPEDPAVTVIAPGDPLPSPGSVPANSTLLLLPGEHRPKPGADGWRRFTLPENARVYLSPGAILYAALDSGGKWGARNITLEGFGIISGEEQRRCPNRTDVSQKCCDNKSPQGLTLTGVTSARVTGVTFIDHPNHHIITQATDCTANAGYAGIMDNVKILGWRANGDGVHVFGSWRISRMFMRTQDDTLYLSCGTNSPPDGCATTIYSQITTWNDANGASFCFLGNGTRLEDSDVIYARASWAWWDGGRVFSQRGDWTAHNVTVSGLRVTDPKPSLNAFQLKGDSTATATDIVFQNVAIAAFSTQSECKGFGNGCNCVPDCGKGPLPDGVPNLLTGVVKHAEFDNVTLGGVSIAEVLFTPAFNVTSDTVSDIIVDGKRVIP